MSLLPSTLEQPYHTFQQLLECLRDRVSLPDPDRSGLQTLVLEAQQFFQQHLMSLDFEILAPEDAAKVQSVYTETSKQLKLLMMDVSFLKTAHQTATVEKRQKQIGDRLETLLGYGRFLLGEET
jgi:hypothetical protein